MSAVQADRVFTKELSFPFSFGSQRKWKRKPKENSFL
jgi:hypothetical protein